VRAESVLQQSRAARMIAMGVADDDVFDVLWIQTERGQAVDDFVFH